MLAHFNNGDQGLIVRELINNIVDALQKEEAINTNGPTFNLVYPNEFNAVVVTHASGLATLEKITGLNMGTRFFIRPSATTVLTINDKLKVGVVAGANIKLNAEQKIIDGSKGGYLELQMRTVGGVTDFYEVGFNDQYNN